MEGVEEVYAFASVEDLTDSIYSAVALQDLAHKASASPDHLRKVVQFMRVPALAVDDLLSPDLDVLLGAETFDSVDG